LPRSRTGRGWRRPVARLRLESENRVTIGFAILAGVVVVGTSWFTLVENFSLIDGLYQTVLTISTVGFREVHPLDDGAKIFTIFVILFGVGATLFTVTAFFETVVEDQIGRIGRRRMERKIAGLSGHAVVCGYGRVGRTVAKLLDPSIGVVVIDNEAERAAHAAAAGYPTIEGDATDDEVLARAGLARARTLVAAVPSDADNLYIVLSGRALEPSLHIVARARAEVSEPKLLRAGADRVINPQEIGARRMAAFALQPAVSDFVDVVVHGSGDVAYRLEEFRIDDQASVAGSSIRDAQIRDRTGALVLALRSGDDHFVTNPGPDTLLDPGMTVIAIGTPEQLDRLHAYVERRDRGSERQNAPG